MNTRAVFGLAALSFFLCTSLPAEAQRKQKNVEVAAPEWAVYAVPNENHQVLEQLVGRWSHTARWWGSAGSKPQEAQGVNLSRWSLGKRFVEGETRRKMGREQYEGLSMIGYDSLKKQYTWTSFDTLSTGVLQAFGEYDSSAKLFSFTGTASDPVSGTAARPFRAEIKIFDAESYSVTMYLKDMQGAEFRSAEILYSKK